MNSISVWRILGFLTKKINNLQARYKNPPYKAYPICTWPKNYFYMPTFYVARDAIVLITPLFSHMNIVQLEWPHLNSLAQQSKRSKVYENSHKNVLYRNFVQFGIEVKNSTILIFKFIFLCQNSSEFFWFFFHWRIEKREKNF